MTTNLNITDLKSGIYEAVCDEWKSASAKLKEQEEYVSSLRDQVIALSGGDRMEYGVRVQKVHNRGKVDYKAIVEVLEIAEDEKDMYRGEDFTSWKVTKY